MTDTTPIEEPREAEVDASTYREPITLRTHTLGLDPYVLIRAVKRATDGDDPDDDGLRLKVEHNDDGAALAMLYVLNLPAADNPLTAAIKAVIDANPDAPEVPEVLAMFAEFCDIPMPESGR
jgi:hypothetical protein